MASPAGQPLGLIAGNGRLPLLVAREARRQGRRVVAVAHRGETLPELVDEVDHLTWVGVGALRKITRAFRDAGVEQAIFAGGLGKARLLRDFRPDTAALGILLRLRSRDDDAVLRAVAEYFRSQGIAIVDAAPLVPGLYAPEGVLTRRVPTAREEEDIAQGWRVAKALGGLDVGQTVAMKSGATVAVEAMEGTDELIRRAGRLAGEGVVLVKVSKPGQDLRFDVPTVGSGTLQVMIEHQVRVLAVEAGKTLLLDRTEMVSLADRNRISIVGRSS